jgi:hypothetical protein
MFDSPSFLIQIGHNGHLLADDILSEGYADGAILSPADYELSDNISISNTIHGEEGDVLFDPQFYIPRTERPGLSTYSYFDEFGGGDFETSGVLSEVDELVRGILSTQDQLEVDAYISPARFLDVFSEPKIEIWVELTEAFLEIVDDEGRDIPVFASLPVYQTSLIDVEQRTNLLNRITQFDTDGFYVSAKFDNEVRYPLTGSSNVYAFLDLLNTLKRARYEIIVGHTHQIAHLLFGIGVDAFASGHYQNLRAFDTRRWDPEDEQGGGRLVSKYYSDKILNELRVDPELDLMYQKSNFDIETIRTPSPYDEDLFDSSIPPSASGWKFRDATWDHYIWSCYQIAQRYSGVPQSERFQLAWQKIVEAEELYEKISSKFGMLSEPEPAIYSDWKDGLSLIEDEL